MHRRTRARNQEADVEGPPLFFHLRRWDARDSRLSPTKKTGATAAHIFGQGTTYTYDDIIFLPGFIGFGAHEVRGHV
jgi:hypothetical protein